MAFERLPLSFKSLINIYFDDIYKSFLVFFRFIKSQFTYLFYWFFLLCFLSDFFCKRISLHFKIFIIFIYVFVLRFYSRKLPRGLLNGNGITCENVEYALMLQREDDCQLCFVTGSYFSALSTKCI